MMFTFTLRCPNCDSVLNDRCAFEPDIPPVPCSNPDDPRYSDPGSIGCVDDYPEKCPECGEQIEEQYAWSKGQQALEDKIEEAMERKAEAYWEDRGRKW